jgi:metal-sulfur cluster biosynthetic enzyme
MGPSIADEVKSKVESIPGVAEAKVDLVWEPPWTMEMMSEEARLHLGMM